MTDPSAAGVRAPEFCVQEGFAYRFDWGLSGLQALAPHASVVVIVDVLRFTSAVSAAVESGCTVYPYRWADDGASAYAHDRNAVLAGRREDGDLSLSPTDLLTAASGTRIVLPSPNGSALAFAARDHGSTHVLAGCLRNATATARVARDLAALSNGVIAVIASGERWSDATGPLRPAIEDLLGAGAVLAALDPSGAVAAPCCSPEAAIARAAFIATRPTLPHTLAHCASGLELVARGWSDDVATAAAHDVTTTAAQLVGDAFVAVPAGGEPSAITRAGEAQSA